MTGGRCVVFGYSEVGVRCLKALHSLGAELALVVTHEDDPAEHRWYGSVADTARDLGVPVTMPASAADPALRSSIERIAPDFIFSFYYRHMIAPELLALAGRGALNMHGSLLPKFRGRAPVNWAVAKGATETGATLHHMVGKPDAGDIVGQLAVPILGDDTAQEVFGKVLVAAEVVLWRAWPALLRGDAPRLPQDLSQGSYFGRRRPEDGRIDWRASAREVHDLVRAVAPPYPGAFTDLPEGRLFIHRTRRLGRTGATADDRHARARIVLREDRALIECADGEHLALLDGKMGDLSALEWLRRRGSSPLVLPDGPTA
ncbi:MAG: formyltransferase [Gammaproteobacteria bacterium]|nr:formyltransferase [Gammaproteobacteria bacterium]